MDDFESYLSKANDKQLKLWSETTRSAQLEEARPAKLPPLRVSPKRSPKSGPPEQNKFVKIVNVRLQLGNVFSLLKEMERYLLTRIDCNRCWMLRSLKHSKS